MVLKVMHKPIVRCTTSAAVLVHRWGSVLVQYACTTLRALHCNSSAGSVSSASYVCVGVLASDHALVAVCVLCLLVWFWCIRQLCTRAARDREPPWAPVLPRLILRPLE
jgi:hypothetical protein